MQQDQDPVGPVDIRVAFLHNVPRSGSCIMHDPERES